jgi:fumarate reductase subunit D
LFETIKSVLRKTFNSRAIGVASLIAVAVGVMMLGILLPIGLSAWEDYTPTNATLVTIWPIGAVLIVLAIVLGFFKDQQ